MYSISTSRLLLLLAIVISSACPLGAQTAEYLRIHQEATVADGHNDILGRVMKGERIDVRSDKGHSDLLRFREGGLDVQRPPRLPSRDYFFIPNP